ncbi:hypothetical protein [Nocardia huaxiensis]|uniref:Lipoprotein n=1 Tax=Nocardia huaxiensis TaxID=2755382 RepID=A0A7D6Z2Z8_9NOCA|nr:hypothetical protein [Nocardia huaxiensis]QLY29644.1 hypothetical protein H0264_31095 [Nocardia huaxiensis]UFS96782.1 hypothetical protein LPY97_02285 [Nocardia huaxiensis]
MIRRRLAHGTLLVAVVAAAGCLPWSEPSPTTTAPPPSTVIAQLGTPFTLSPGATAHLDDERLTVLFNEVSSDSRCPVDVDCVWEGNAIIVLTVVAAGVQAEHQLATAYPELAADTAGGYRLTLVNLSPERRHSDGEIPPQNYRVDLIAARP